MMPKYVTNWDAIPDKLFLVQDSEDECGESPLKNENSGGLSDDRPLSPAISGVTGNFDAFVEQQLRLEHQVFMPVKLLEGS